MPVWRHLGNLDPTGRSFSPMDSFHKPSFLSSLQRRAVKALRGFRPVFMLASRLAQPLIYGGRLGSYQRFGRQTSTRQLDGCLRGSFFPTRIERCGGECSQRYNPTNHLVSTCVLAACPTKFTVMSLKWRARSSPGADFHSQWLAVAACVNHINILFCARILHHSWRLNLMCAGDWNCKIMQLCPAQI